MLGVKLEQVLNPGEPCSDILIVNNQSQLKPSPEAEHLQYIYVRTYTDIYTYVYRYIYRYISIYKNL